MSAFFIQYTQPYWFSFVIYTERRYRSLDELYARVSSATKQALYQFIKDQDVSLLNYHFDYYFRFCIQENNIQEIPQNF